jgi:phage gp46-like protein
MESRKIDPMTGDYSKSNGNYVRETSAAVAKSVLRMRTRKGSILCAPNVGNEFHTLQKVTANTEVRAKSLARAAHKDMIDAKEISDFVADCTIETRSDGTALLAITVAFTDNKGQRQTTQTSHRMKG